MKNNNGHKHNYPGKPDGGGSLIEALIAITIIVFVVVSILAAISQQQATTKNTTDKNAAVMMAEMRMEELLKFPSLQLAEESYTDHIIFKEYGFEIYDEAQPDPRQEKQFRRTTTITKDLLQQVATIRVQVEYGAYFKDIAGAQLVYPARVVLTSRRSTK